MTTTDHHQLARHHGTRRRHRATRRRGADGACTPTTPVVTIIDRDHPPAARRCCPAAGEIAAYYRDICGRNIDHEVSMLVADASGVGFEQHCRYPEGSAVICVTVASVEGGLIRRQTIAQAWD